MCLHVYIVVDTLCKAKLNLLHFVKQSAREMIHVLTHVLHVHVLCILIVHVHVLSAKKLAFFSSVVGMGYTPLYLYFTLYYFDEDGWQGVGGEKCAVLNYVCCHWAISLRGFIE